MMDSRNLAYLDAMGIDVWQSRVSGATDDSGPAPPQIVIGQGDGDILCIVDSSTGAELALAKNIGGAMRCPPVWSWPQGSSEGGGETLSIEEAVSEKMLTRVLVFGEELAAGLFGPEIPSVICTARVHLVPSLDELAQDSGAKRVLWRLMNENGIAASRGGGH